MYRMDYMFNWESHSLTDPFVVRTLFEYNRALNPMYATVRTLSEPTINAYADFMDIIARCRFSDSQAEILELMLWGYTDIEIARDTGRHINTVTGVRNTIIKKITDRSVLEWTEWFTKRKFRSVERRVSH